MPADRSPHTVGTNRYSAPSVRSSVRYTHRCTGSAAAASWENEPMSGRTWAGTAPIGSHSHTRPLAYSSQLSHVPHGVAPPAQLIKVSDRQRPAPTMVPSAAKRT